MDYLVLLKMNGFYTIMADAESLPFKNEFDLIIMVDILEHVLDTEKALHCVRRALREAGIVIIRVPFKEDISKYAIAAGCKYEFVHLRSFDKEDIISLLNKCGLNPIQFHYDGYTLDKARLLIRLPISFILNSFTIIKQLFKCKNNSVKDLKAIKDQMSEQINRIVSTLPNWLANIFFHPIELVVIASSNHVRKQQVYGLTSPRVINELHKRGTNYLREKHLITLRYVL
jgi:SAM-dependent methyltransferase